MDEDTLDEESPDLREFLNELVSLCERNLPKGHNGCWGETPLELVTAIVDERDELRFVARERKRLIDSIFTTLRNWHRTATSLKPGQSGQRLWYLTDKDIDHLHKWSDGICELIDKGPLDKPHNMTCKSRSV